MVFGLSFAGYYVSVLVENCGFLNVKLVVMNCYVPVNFWLSKLSPFSGCFAGSFYSIRTWVRVC